MIRVLMMTSEPDQPANGPENFLLRSTVTDKDIFPSLLIFESLPLTRIHLLNLSSPLSLFFIMIASAWTCINF